MSDRGCGWCESNERMTATGVCESCFQGAPDWVQEALYK